MTLEGQFEYYCCMQHDFTEACKMIDSYVRDLYVLPKKFVENTGPALNKYINEYSFATTGARNVTPYEVVLDFIEQLDNFTENTLELYREHKQHSAKSRMYFNKVAGLKRTSRGRRITEYAPQFVQLTPEVRDLHNGLKKIKAHADEMVEMLEQLELRWEVMRPKVCA